MEAPIIQSSLHHDQHLLQKLNFINNQTSSGLLKIIMPPPFLNLSSTFPPSSTIPTLRVLNETIPLSLENLTTPLWNATSEFLRNVSSDLDYDFHVGNTTGKTSHSWALCKDWTPAQHSLFQTANFFFAAAFLVPGSFKQSVLLVRALLSVGYLFISTWGGTEICALDILLWNALIVVLNVTHTILLTWKFLPPALSLEMTELYLKVFKPLRVNKKHFKELIKEAKVITVEAGDIYANEDVSPADEQLSIVLHGKFKVEYNETHLHFVNVYEFVDSPEWEANHQKSDDLFQVTILAEEDSTYLSWPRTKLERVLRHRPMLKVIMDSLIGKDITQKLYAINEHLAGLSNEKSKGERDALWAKAHPRSMSLDAVNTGTAGLVRSQIFKKDQRSNLPEVGAVRTVVVKQPWAPVASQFPVKSPFLTKTSSNSLKIPNVNTSPMRTKSVKKPSNREVKFEDTAVTSSPSK